MDGTVTGEVMADHQGGTIVVGKFLFDKFYRFIMPTPGTEGGCQTKVFSINIPVIIHVKLQSLEIILVAFRPQGTSHHLDALHVYKPVIQKVKPKLFG